MIPKQLQKDCFRFIKVKDSKAPLEGEWTTKNNYAYNDSSFQSYIKQKKRYGVLCGKGNLVVIDFDHKDVQDEIASQLPKTFTVRSAGKGLLHLYYLVDRVETIKVLDLNKNTLADIQGHGRQVIGANSMLNNKGYEIVDDIDIARIEFNIIKKAFSRYLDKPKQNKDEYGIKSKISLTSLLSKYGFDVSKNPTKCIWHDMKGSGNFSFSDRDGLWHCFHCGKGGDIFNLVMEAENCDFNTARKKLAEQAGIKIETTAKEEIAKTKANLIINNIKTFSQMIEEGCPKIEWIVDEMIPKKGTVMFFGDPKSKKTMLATDLALACATGSTWINKFTAKKCSVLYLDLENGNVTAHVRTEKLRRGRYSKFDVNNYNEFKLSIAERIKLDDEEEREVFLEILKKIKPNVLIIDSLVRTISGDENKSGDMNKIFETMKEYMKENEICIICLHHANKGGGYRGSSDILAQFDIVYRVRRVLLENRRSQVDLICSRLTNEDKFKPFDITLDEVNSEGKYDENEAGLVLNWDERRENLSKAVKECIDDIISFIKTCDEDIIDGKELKNIIMEEYEHNRTTYFKSLKEVVNKNRLIPLNKKGEVIKKGGKATKYRINQEDLGDFGIQV